LTSVMDLGAQVISANFSAIGRMLGSAGLEDSPVSTAQELYRRFGCDSHSSIDANGEGSAHIFDLNRNLAEHYDYLDRFDLVTNLGTLEHCFDQAVAFENMHRLCRPGGLMIHCLPTQGLVNHGFYNYHPRFVADLAAANNYNIVDLFFTVDFGATQITYTLDAFQQKDGRDLLLYAVLRRADDGPFRTPFDGMFSAQNRVGYGQGENQVDVLGSQFRPYLKTSWANVLSEE
jgi:SAM-dependent methyltransferase